MRLAFVSYLMTLRTLKEHVYPVIKFLFGEIYKIKKRKEHILINGDNLDIILVGREQYEKVSNIDASNLFIVYMSTDIPENLSEEYRRYFQNISNPNFLILLDRRGLVIDERGYDDQKYLRIHSGNIPYENPREGEYKKILENLLKDASELSMNSGSLDELLSSLVERKFILLQDFEKNLREIERLDTLIEKTVELLKLRTIWKIGLYFYKPFLKRIIEEFDKVFFYSLVGERYVNENLKRYVEMIISEESLKL